MAAADQQAAQTGIASALVVPVRRAWSATVNTADLRSSLPALVESIRALVAHFGPMSGAVAREFYMRERRAAGVRGAFTPSPGRLPPASQVEDSVRWATRGLWSADPSYQVENVAVSQQELEAVVNRLVLDVGRDAIAESIAKDSRARGWAREPEPGACAFCALLATRGAVYKEHSFDRANARFAGGGRFKTHNDCRCVMVPVFGVYEPTAAVRQWQQMYRESTAGVHGARAMRRAFRSAVDAARH